MIIPDQIREMILLTEDTNLTKKVRGEWCEILDNVAMHILKATKRARRAMEASTPRKKKK